MLSDRTATLPHTLPDANANATLDGFAQHKLPLTLLPTPTSASAEEVRKRVLLPLLLLDGRDAARRHGPHAAARCWSRRCATARRSRRRGLL